MDKLMLLNIEYKSQGQEYVSLQNVTDNSDPTKLVADYMKVEEEEASKKSRNMWCYGDFTPDDACEFGYQKS